MYKMDKTSTHDLNKSNLGNCYDSDKSTTITCDFKNQGMVELSKVQLYCLTIDCNLNITSRVLFFSNDHDSNKQSQQKYAD